MKYLLDASTLLPLVTKRGKQLLIEVAHEDLVTTDLAIYEACNSLWKLSKLLKVISMEDAVNTAILIKDLTVKGVVKPINFTKLNFSNTIKVSYEEGLTFYDASYIIAAKDSEAILVTEDEKLQKLAHKYVKTIGYNDLEARLAKI
ncbi:MAG: type II toxin-antitoxin system VapC family toxin [Nitrososphaeria archaeon]